MTCLALALAPAAVDPLRAIVGAPIFWHALRPLSRARGITQPIILTDDAVASRRAEKLRIECLQTIDDKPAALRRWASDNDVNDVDYMQIVGCAACPADSHPTALAAAQLVFEKAGGHGAVRELCGLLLAHRSAAATPVEAPV